MKVKADKPKVRTLDEMLTGRDRILLRCVDCQTFFLPAEIHMAVFRYRDPDTREARAIPVEICPVCYSGIGSPEYEKVREDDIPRSTFVTLTRHDYEQTKLAEKWGMRYDLKTKEMTSDLLVH